VGGAIATLVGGGRWGGWTVAIMGATWLVPWFLVIAGAPSPVDIPWPSQYLRLLALHVCLSASVVAAIRLVMRSLERSLETGDQLLQRVRQEARATQALAGRLTEAEENERAKLSRELHDDLGQRLTALRMKLQLGQLGSGLTPSALDECVSISEDLLRDVRTFARGLRPPLLDEVGLVPALRAMIDLHTDPQVHVVTVDAPDAVARLPHSVELAAYRVLQEALGNVLRHAGATRLTLEIVDEDLELIIALSDNGCGFDPAAVARESESGEHLGLVSMRERAEFIAADLHIQSAPGKGTTVRLRIPRTTTASILLRVAEPALTL
jgi:signal transduction histidine kinase